MKPIDIIHKLQNKGFEAYFIGGAVRDMLMNVKPKDFDIVTSATPEEIIDIFKNQCIKEVGKSFGVIIVDGTEVATYRSDTYYGGSDKNVKIEYGKTLEEDIVRRDFTINGIAYNPKTDEFLDYVNGKEDIKNKIVRFIGDPRKRIFEDPNRIIRACRFKARINGKIERISFEYLCTYSKYIKSHVSPERIRLEILKSMEIKKASKFFIALKEIYGLKYIFPSLDNCHTTPGGPYHIENVFEHCMDSGDHCSTRFPLVKLAAYLHDVGKFISCRTNIRTNDIWFQGHEITGYAIVKDELKKLRFSMDEINTISNLILLHMRISESRIQPKSVRRTLAKLKEFDLPYQSLLRLSICDKMGNRRTRDFFTFKDVKKLVNHFREQANRKDSVSQFSDLKVNGHDVMEITGLKPGKEIGNIIKYLFDLIVDNPELNNKESLTKLINERNL
jgi:tRNA nucleotidyltransferase (CCA-adding enzyme)